MYTKKILSVSAAIAVLATSASAFETKADGTIAAGDKNSSYVSDATTPAANALELSGDLKGDALIYPFYSRENGWESEIVVRNTTGKAIVAKAVLYGNEESEELVDFNIYLSPFDAFRFTIKDDNIYTSDGSVPISTYNPNLAYHENNLKWDQVTFNPHDGEEFAIIAEDEAHAEGLRRFKASTKGYVAIYGMTQYNPDSTSLSDNYHNNHEGLWKDYRRLLDDCRDGWRKSFINNGMEQGMMVMSDVNVTAPDVNITCGKNDGAVLADDANTTDANSSIAGYDLSKFGDVDESALVGTVRVSNAGEADADARDLLLPATALKNFTDDNMVLWTDGEYANIADRRIDTDGKYPVADLLADAEAFMTKSAIYTYSKDSLANKMLVTQPMKRVLTSLTGGADHIWFQTGNSYGFFAHKMILDEDENIAGEAFNPQAAYFTSPYNPGGEAAQVPYMLELDELRRAGDVENKSNLQYEDYVSDEMKSGNGFVVVSFDDNDDSSADPEYKGLPAIVTQMTGSKVNGVAQTNWIYAPTTK